ncbi:MAG: hypothetical protein WCV85_02815 [Patescibacteria group bacterium]
MLISWLRQKFSTPPIAVSHEPLCPCGGTLQHAEATTSFAWLVCSKCGLFRHPSCVAGFGKK